MIRRGGKRRRSAGPAAALVRGLLVVAVLGAIALVALRAYNGVPLRDYRTLYVVAPAAGNLRVHDQVRMAGVRAGQVMDFGIRGDGRARIRLQLEPDAPALPVDSDVAIRAAGLLGARYVELVPGRSERTLGSGSTIQAPEDALSFGVPEMLDTFDAPTRARFRSLLGELGSGMLGRGRELNDAIRQAAAGQRPLQAVAESVLARPGAAQRFFPSVDSMLTTLAASRRELGMMFAPAATALEPFVDRRQSVHAALDEAPPALDAADTGLDAGRRLLASTRALATAVNETLPAAPAALDATTTLLRTSHAPLRRGTSLLRAGRQSVPAILRVTRALSPVLTPMRQGFDELAPMVAYFGRYGCDIRHLGAVFRSMTGLGATPGGEIGPIGQFRFQLIPSPAENVGSEKPDTARTRHRYPAPCTYLEYADADAVGGPR